MSIHHRSFVIEDGSVVTDLILRNYLIATYRLATLFNQIV